MTLLDRLTGWIGRILAGTPEEGSAPVAAPGDVEREAGESGESAEDGAPGPDDVVVMPIEDSLDLHTFAPRDVASVVEEYLHEARAHGFREVRVIHGKGRGVQRRIVQGVLSRHPAVESFRDAPARRGGWGATLVLLRPK